MEKLKIAIFGSCVCREAFNEKPFTENGTLNIQIKPYIQKNSLITMFDDKIDVEVRDEEIASNVNYIKRVTLTELKKDAVNQLKSHIGDFFVIDFAELRFGIIKVAKSGKTYRFTYTLPIKQTLDNLKTRGVLEDSKFDVEIPYDYPYEVLEQYIQSFADFVRGLYTAEQIVIINSVNCVEFINDNNCFESYDNIPKLLKESNLMALSANMFNKCFDNKVRIINIPSDVSSDCNHYLGNSPLHYEKSCYEYIANCLSQIFYNNATQTDIDKLYIEYFDRLKPLKRSIRIKTNIYRTSQKNKC